VHYAGIKNISEMDVGGPAYNPSYFEKLRLAELCFKASLGK
jgi:hypothetical protein